MFVEVDSGTRVFVQDWGSGKPVVFVHGWPLNHKIFEYQMVALMRLGYRAIGVDLRGFGQSDKPWQGNDYDTWAEDLEKVIDALDLEDAMLAGFSMGGAIAMHYAATRRDSRVTRLALMGAAGPIFSERQDNPSGTSLKEIKENIRLAFTDRSKLAHDLGVVNFHTPASPEFYRWIEGLRMEASLHATIRGIEELRDRDLRQEIPHIGIPTRIYHGVHDHIVSFALAEEQHRLIKNSVLVPFHNSGHGLFYDEKDKLNEELAKFLQG